MTTESLILIIGGFFTATSAMIVAYVNRQNSSIREQFDALKGVVDLLHNENSDLNKEIKGLKAENAKQYKLINEQEAEIADLRREIAERDGSLKQVRAWAEILVGQLRENHIQPVPMPDREITKPLPRSKYYDDEK